MYVSPEILVTRLRRCLPSIIFPSLSNSVQGGGSYPLSTPGLHPIQFGSTYRLVISVRECNPTLTFVVTFPLIFLSSFSSSSFLQRDAMGSGFLPRQLAFLGRTTINHAPTVPRKQREVPLETYENLCFLPFSCNYKLRDTASIPIYQPSSYHQEDRYPTNV